LYAISAMLLIIALKGGELSVLYPIIALSYIWVILASTIVLKENISTLRWAGVGIIFAGVTIVGIGGKK
jgi:drug/metabolite transporter (DMT)-like permease